MDNYIEKQYFNYLFNRRGYVLDFTTKDFDDFTLQSVGIALCKTYKDSKGRSLKQFITKILNTLLGNLFSLYLLRYFLSLNTFSIFA